MEKQGAVKNVGGRKMRSKRGREGRTRKVKESAVECEER